MSKKIAVIGAGKWGQNIIKTLYELNLLTAVVEVQENLRNNIISLYPDIPVVKDVEEIINQISAVAIATPVITHFAIAKQALLEDKDVFVEKPMTMTSEEAQELCQLAKSRNKILMCGHMLLYQPAIQFIKQFIRDGKLGKLYSLRQVRRNLGTVRKQENVLYSLGVHDLAVWNYLLADRVVMTKAVGQAIVNPKIAGDISVHVQYQSGVMGHLHVCWLWPIKDRHLMILGEKGALLYDELQHTVTWYKNYVDNYELVRDGSEVIFQGSGEPLRLEMQHFADCINHRVESLSSGEQGLAVVELLESIDKQLV